MKQSCPDFGVRIPDVKYVERPGAYAIILGENGKLAVVEGKNGWLFLPGGGLAPDEKIEEALAREISEEIGWRIRILGLLGRATQFLLADGEGYFAIRATYFRVELIEQSVARCEHEIIWLPVNEATRLARESDAWAIQLLESGSASP